MALRIKELNLMLMEFKVRFARLAKDAANGGNKHAQLRESSHGITYIQFQCCARLNSNAMPKDSERETWE